LLLHSSFILLYTLGPIFVPVLSFAHPTGVVDCTLEWHSGRQVYTYVFSGIVSSKGRPCPNAKVQLQISTPNQPDMVQETVASADGTYQLKIDLAGHPDQSAEWKLIAQAPETGAAELEGRSILMEGENRVEVQRPLQLIQG